MFRTVHYVLVQAIIMATGVMVACGSRRPQAAEASPVPLTVPRATASTIGPEAKAVARQEGASFLTQITFRPKSFDITEVARLRLLELLKKAKAAGRIEMIHLIVWSDKEYPSTTRKTLSQDEVRLADRRAKAVNDFLRERDIKADVEAYNMAERPNPILSILSTADARIKRTLEGAGLATTAQDLSAPEYASKAVVLVLLAK